MNEIELIIDLHKNTKRQGPGSEAATLRALALSRVRASDALVVADIGCGTGAQTITLAQQLNAQITAVDLAGEFLHKLNSNAAQHKLASKIITRCESMDALSFELESLDLIWSEGAIYNIGFEKGIKAWKPFLKQNACIVASELTWISNERPQEIEDFWTTHYPEVSTASHKIALLEANGFTLLSYFYLPATCWMENYYEPLIKEIPAFLKRQNNSDLAQKVARDSILEKELYEKYKAFYSYGFYIAIKN